MNKLDKILESKKILIVDDESFMRTVLNGIVKHIGFKAVSEARDGKAALDMLKVKSFDVCFCDWEMPGMTGLEVFQELKNNDELKGIRFVMVTGNIEASKVKEAMEHGITEYIAKPFNEDIIRQKLVKVLSQ